jgi:hypothetical protein
LMIHKDLGGNYFDTCYIYRCYKQWNSTYFNCRLPRSIIRVYGDNAEFKSCTFGEGNYQPLRIYADNVTVKECSSVMNNIQIMSSANKAIVKNNRTAIPVTNAGTNTELKSNLSL